MPTKALVHQMEAEVEAMLRKPGKKNTGVFTRDYHCTDNDKLCWWILYARLQLRQPLYYCGTLANLEFVLMESHNSMLVH